MSQTYLHPSQMTEAQRRGANAGMFDRLAQLPQPSHQRAAAASARRAASKIRAAGC